MVLLSWVGVLVFAGASFFFALAESALFTLGKWQARQLAERSPASGAVLTRLLAEPQDLLATIVLGNTVANAAVVAIILLEIPLQDKTMYLVLPALLFLILVGCEVAPKALAVRAPELWALRVAGPMELLLRLSRPFHRLAQRINGLLLRRAAGPAARTGLSDEEYQELLDLAFQQGSVARSEKEIILQIIGLDRRTALDVMRPRTRMAALSVDASVEEMIEAARRFKHRRLPIYDETLDTIVGVLNARALLLDPQMELEEAIEFPSFVPASMNLLQLFKSLQRQQRGLAIVMDEFGGTAGIVTMADILEEVVGGIYGEGEPQGFVMEKLAEGRWRVNGTMRIEDFRREYPELGDVPEIDTMGGLLTARLEVVPLVGESAVYRGLKLQALVVEERRVREVLVERFQSGKTHVEPSKLKA
jgi:putative hemolysin